MEIQEHSPPSGDDQPGERNHSSPDHENIRPGNFYPAPDVEGFPEGTRFWEDHPYSDRHPHDQGYEPEDEGHGGDDDDAQRGERHRLREREVRQSERVICFHLSVFFP